MSPDKMSPPCGHRACRLNGSYGGLIRAQARLDAKLAVLIVPDCMALYGTPVLESSDLPASGSMALVHAFGVADVCRTRDDAGQTLALAELVRDSPAGVARACPGIGLVAVDGGKGVHRGWWIRPSISGMVDALEQAYEQRHDVDPVKLRESVAQYEVGRVAEEHMKPTVDTLLDRMAARRGAAVS